MRAFTKVLIGVLLIVALVTLVYLAFQNEEQLPVVLKDPNVSDPISSGDVMKILDDQAVSLPFSIDYVEIEDGAAILGTTGAQCCGGGFVLVDINDLSNPLIKGQYDTFGLINSIYVHENYVYIGESPSGKSESFGQGIFEVVDVSDYENPTQIHQETFDYSVNSVIGQDDKIAVSGRFGVVLFKLDQSGIPHQIAQYFENQKPYRIVIEGDKLIIVFDSGETYAIDLIELGEPDIVE